jgi:hypothetical protein
MAIRLVVNFSPPGVSVSFHLPMPLISKPVRLSKEHEANCRTGFNAGVSPFFMAFHFRIP